MTAPEFFPSLAEFWAWARRVMPNHAVAAAAAADQAAMSGFYAMQALTRAVGWREMADTESVRQTVQEFTAWWVERHPEDQP